MKTTMDMDSFEYEQDKMEIEYGEEIMCAGWNPAVNQICEQLLQVQADEPMPMAAELAALDIPEDIVTAVSEIFLRKMYTYQR